MKENKCGNVEASETVSNTKQGLLLQPTANSSVICCMRSIVLFSMYMYAMCMCMFHSGFLCVHFGLGPCSWFARQQQQPLQPLNPPLVNATLALMPLILRVSPLIYQNSCKTSREGERDRKANKTYKRDPSVIQTSSCEADDKKWI